MSSFKRRRISFFAKLRNYFITGVVVLIPIGLTLYLTKFTIEVSSDINLSNYVIFYAGTKLNPHKDPNILRHPYKRIQIPLNVPKGECYMQWTNLKFEKIKWKEGVPQICDVCNHTHEAYNNTSDPIEFLFVDIHIKTM